jgi:hypothetical protein
VRLSLPAPTSKPRDSIGRMSVGYPRSESDYAFEPRAVFFRLLVCLGLYPSDRRFLASFGGALKDTLGRGPLR